jgi:hypothetical protein
MTSTRLVPWQFALRSGSIVVAFAGLVVAACNQTPPIQSGSIQVQDSSKSPEPLRAPQLSADCKPGRPPSTRAELTACLEGLEFDSIEAVGDKQPLMVNPPCPESCRYGPLATIQPEKHSHLYSDAELKEGRIIAKLTLDPKETKGYKKLGLVPGGVTYWWVQKTSENYDKAGKSVYVTLQAEELRAPIANTLQYTEHKNGFQQAVARWVWDPKDEKTQGTCGQGCCH